MAKILKPYEVQLDDELAAEILAIPMDAPVGDPPRTIGERVLAAAAAVAAANEHLHESRLAKIVATSVMKVLKKRGVASVQVRPDGIVILRVAYDETEEEHNVPVKRATRRSDLPKLDDLRAQAAELGVDISDLGQQRRAIFERIQENIPAVPEG